MISTTTMEPQYLKVKDKKHDQWSNQKLLHHFHHAWNQLSSSIYSWDKTDFRVPGQTYFYRHIWPDPITIEGTFSFPAYIWACKKSAYFSLLEMQKISLLEMQKILESHDVKGHTRIWPCLTNKYWVGILIFNFP